MNEPPQQGDGLMLNHAIDNLTTAQEDAYLTTGLTPFKEYDDAGRGCHFGMLDRAALVTGTNDKNRPAIYGGPRYGGDRNGMLVDRFNSLCVRLGGSRRREAWYRTPTADDLAGAARLGVLIRNRILSNRARRVLQNRPVHTVSR